jgi:FkbM family methyltransferase
MIIVLRLLRWFKYHNPSSIRKALNTFYYNPKIVNISIENIDCVMVDGCYFKANSQIDSIQRICGNPWFDNIRKDDVVLDIGANIGAISIPLAKVAKHVYAVEPLFIDELRMNIQLNNLDNVEIIEFGLGSNNSSETIRYGQKRAICKTITMDEILRITGRVDFIKIDCEGAEWLIEPELYKGIREIRMELHIRRKNKRSDLVKFDKLKQWLMQNNYEVDIKRDVQAAQDIYFSECILLDASRKE